MLGSLASDPSLRLTCGGGRLSSMPLDMFGGSRLMRTWSILALSFLMCCSCAGWHAIDSTQAGIDMGGSPGTSEVRAAQPVGPEIEIAGFYGSSFEYSGFTPCGAKDVYWTEGTEVRMAFSALHLPRGEHAYARLRGRVLGPGSYGHMGAYKWGFSVSAVLEMRAKRDGDCR